MKRTIKSVIWMIVITIALIIIFGPPKFIHTPFATWESEGEEIIEGVGGDKKPVPAHEAITIDDTRWDKKIYKLYENATIHFTINNQFNLPFEFSVFWFNHENRYYGWDAKYNKTHSYSTWYSLNDTGEWKMQIEISWTYKNQTYSGDYIDIVEVY